MTARMTRLLACWLLCLHLLVAPAPALASPPALPLRQAGLTTPRPAMIPPPRERPALPDPPEVVEYLRVRVPARARQAWLEAERASWGPWLAEQEGFLGRDLYWDAQREEGVLLIRWRRAEDWFSIPAEQLEGVQERFELVARRASGQRSGNPFPLVAEGKLLPEPNP
jgi:uncharacterized protein (TIGR03792 family)